MESVSHWLNKSKKTHKNIYDYSKVVYKNSQEKVLILCPYHGEFYQKLSVHANGQKCKLCYLYGKLSKKDYVRSILIKNGNENYNYDNIELLSNSRVKIFCRNHGSFIHNIYKHSKGQMCPGCAKEKLRISNKIKFIIRANKIHNNKYDYKDVVYSSAKEAVKIHCPIHGIFEQSPDQHLNTTGCRACSATPIITSDIFIKRAEKIHGKKYNYNKVRYKSAKKKVLITCTTHGDFKTSPDNHLKGNGCPHCGDRYSGWSPSSWNERGKNSVRFDSFKVYIIKCRRGEEEFYKIGKTFLTIACRFSGSLKLPYDFNVTHVFVFNDGLEASKYEKLLHKINKNNKYTPELYFPGNGECFKSINIDYADRTEQRKIKQ